MLRRWIVLLGWLLLAASPAGAVCNLTGDWYVTDASGSYRLNLREDAPGGVLVGSFFSDVFGASSAVAVTGTHTGLDVTLSLGGTEATGTLVTCEGMGLIYTATSLGVGARRERTTYCGDGIVNGFQETCDDGNFVNNDACTAACGPAVCGDGVVGPGEACDDFNLREGDGCSNTCEINVCGNGIIEPGESCDDGNTTGGDGCSEYCQHCDLSGTWYGGFNVPGTWSIRDDGLGGLTGVILDDVSPLPVSGTRTETTVSITVPFPGGPPLTFNGSINSCDLLFLQIMLLTRSSDTYCGDGIRQAGEQCDDGNFVHTDDCSATCRLPDCGNGTLDPFEECDAGAANANVPDAACRPDCRSRRCGDGIQDPADGEQCDDGNGVGGDGCSASCALEHSLAGAKLVLRDRVDTRKRKLVIDSRDATAGLGQGNGSADDPVLHGASLRVVTSDGCGGPCTGVYDLPAANWRYVGAANEGRGYAYRDRSGGAIKRVSLRSGRRLKLVGSGPLLDHALAASPAPVQVVFRLGSAIYCMEFGGTTRFDPAKMFSAVDSPALPCPAD